MKEIDSIQIMIKDALSINNILSLYQIVKNYNGFIYFIDGQKIIRPDKLAKFTSYILTCKMNKVITIVAEGADVHNTLLKIKRCFKPLPRTSNSKNIHFRTI